MTRHFRFGHYAEPAGDPADLIVPHHEWEPWDCFCGETITDGGTICPNCSSERGDWLCDCGRKNKSRDGECSECGNPRPDPE